jgi:putative transposase
MKTYSQEFPIERMATVLGVSRRGYYHFLKSDPSAREQENQRLLEQIVRQE